MCINADILVESRPGDPRVEIIRIVYYQRVERLIVTWPIDASVLDTRVHITNMLVAVGVGCRQPNRCAWRN